MATDAAKRCTGCGETRPLDDFHAAKGTRDGLQYRCKQCQREWRQRRMRDKPGIYAARQRAWREANPERAREYTRAYRERNPSTKGEAYRELRESVLDAYGRRCACCGETTPEFLTLDHVNNDGAEHRERLGSRRRASGVFTYRWLRDNGFPREGFQLLCWNCNCAKGRYGECPHVSRATPCIRP